MIIDIQCEETIAVEVFGVDSNHVQDGFVILDFSCPYCQKQYKSGQKVVYAAYRHMAPNTKSEKDKSK